MSVKVYEHGSYFGNSTGPNCTDAIGTPIYTPINPPFAWTVEQTYTQSDPAALPIPALMGYIMITNYVVTFPLLQLIISMRITAQRRKLCIDDTDTGETELLLLGPLTINRAVVEGTMGNWTHTGTKSGYSASMSLRRMFEISYEK